MNNIKINSEGKKDITSIRSLFKVSWKIYLDLNLDKYKDGDTRKALFSKSMHCFRACYLNYEYFYSELIDEDIMRKKMTGLVGSDAKYFELYLARYEYLQFSKTAMQLLLYSSIESSIRSICNSLSIGNPTMPFSHQYKNLIKFLNLKQDYETIIDILSLIRNTVHNNGVYVDHKGQNKVMIYNNVKYEFINMTAIDCVTITNLNDLYRGVLRMFKDIIKHKDILAIPFIKEYYYDGYKEGILSVNSSVIFND